MGHFPFCRWKEGQQSTLKENMNNLRVQWVRGLLEGAMNRAERILLHLEKSKCMNEKWVTSSSACTSSVFWYSRSPLVDPRHLSILLYVVSVVGKNRSKSLGHLAPTVPKTSVRAKNSKSNENS